MVAQVPRMSFVAIVVDVARHALPLLSLYVFHGNFASYVLLTAFDLSLGLMLIVATTRDRGDVNSVDPRSRWLIMRFIAWLVAAALLVFMSAIIAIPIAMPALIFFWNDHGHRLESGDVASRFLGPGGRDVAARRRAIPEPVRSDDAAGETRATDVQGTSHR